MNKLTDNAACRKLLKTASLTGAVWGQLLIAAMSAMPPIAAADEIDLRCESEWGSNRDMVAFCVKNQRNAKREIAAYSGLIRSNCENEWGANYEMVLFCINNQSNAKSKLDNEPRDHITKNCSSEWGSNFEMVEFCVDNQRFAKRTIEQTYSDSGKRPGCESQWGRNYEMVLYCIKGY